MSLILIINVKHESAGYAKLAQELKKIDNQEIQVIMPDPISFTVAKYYLSGNQNIKVKIYNPKDDLSDWEIISKNEILKDYNQLKGKQRIWVYNNANKPDIWYRQTTQIDKLYIYSSVILFDNLASKNPL
jgi:predicted MPP superfamily phosphohydrolase